MSNEMLTIQVTKAQMNFLLSNLKKKPALVQRLLSQEDMDAEWISLAETLSVIGPSYTHDIWMTCWTQLTCEAEEKKERIKLRQSRAKLTDEDLDVLNIVNGTNEELKSIRNNGKGKSVTFQRVPTQSGPCASNNSTPQSCSSNASLSHPNTSQVSSKSTTNTTKAASHSEGVKAPQPFSTSFAKFNQSSRQCEEPSTTSGRTSQKMLQHRSIEAINESNEMIATLARHLLGCFDQHTKILESALAQFNTSLEQMINQIVVAFLNEDLGGNNVEVGPVEEQQIPENNQVDERRYDANDDEDYPMEYLDEDFA